MGICGIMGLGYIGLGKSYHGAAQAWDDVGEGNLGMVQS